MGIISVIPTWTQLLLPLEKSCLPHLFVLVYMYVYVFVESLESCAYHNSLLLCILAGISEN